MNEEDMLAAITQWFESDDTGDPSNYARCERANDACLDGNFNLRALAKMLAEKCWKAV